MLLSIVQLSCGPRKAVYKDNFMTTWNSWFSVQAPIWYKTWNPCNSTPGVDGNPDTTHTLTSLDFPEHMQENVMLLVDDFFWLIIRRHENLCKIILTDQCSKATCSFGELDRLLSVRWCTAVGETHHPARSGGTLGIMADVAKPGNFAACVLVLW